MCHPSAVLFNDGNWPLGPGDRSPVGGGTGVFDVLWLAADNPLWRGAELTVTNPTEDGLRQAARSV